MRISRPTGFGVWNNTIKTDGGSGVTVQNTAPVGIIGGGGFSIDNNDISGASNTGILANQFSAGTPAQILDADILTNQISFTPASPAGEGIRLDINGGATTFAVTGNEVSGKGYFRGMVFRTQSPGQLTVTNFDSNSIDKGYTENAILIAPTANPADTTINGTLDNLIGAPTAGSFRLFNNGGAGTIIINGTSVNLFTTPTVP